MNTQLSLADDVAGDAGDVTARAASEELRPLTDPELTELLQPMLAEDAPRGDLTSRLLIPAEAHLRYQVVAREAGILSGSDVFSKVMQLSAAGRPIETRWQLHDGQGFAAGEVLAEVAGPVQAILTGERVGLNLIQRMSGIATMTAEFVAATAGTRARITDTRKTTPGLRALERYAVRCVGGYNHRENLSEAVLVKDNHLAALAGLTEAGVLEQGALTDALRTARLKLPHTVHYEVEVDRLEQIEAVLAAGVNTILLDNFDAERLMVAVRQIAGRALVETSGSMIREGIAEIAQTGVDIISCGALTHSVRALDIGLDAISAKTESREGKP